MNESAPAEIDTLSLHDALPISVVTRCGKLRIGGLIQVWYHAIENDSRGWENGPAVLGASPAPFGNNQTREDRKSTRLNSSHLGISYAVFCLKKKIHNTKLIDYT